MSFQSTYSSFSAQNLQTLRRRTKNFLRGVRSCRRGRGGAAAASARTGRHASHDSLLSGSSARAASAAGAAAAARSAAGGRGGRLRGLLAEPLRHLRGALQLLVGANREVPQHLVGEPHPPLGLRDERRLRRDLEVVVVGLALAQDREGEAPASPRLVLDDLGAAVGQDLAVFGRHFRGVLVGQVRGDQDDDVVEPHSFLLMDVNPRLEVGVRRGRFSIRASHRGVDSVGEPDPESLDGPVRRLSSKSSRSPFAKGSRT